LRKGQQAPKSVGIAVREANRQRLIIKFNWELIKPYLDIKISKFKITFRLFKTLIKRGLTLKDIKKMGYDKHIVDFMSNFCQEKVNLSKKDFIEDYELGQSLIEIAEKYNIIFGNMTFLKQLYKIKTKGATFIHRKKTEVPLTQRQREIIYGSMLGDAKRFAPASIGFGQGEKQKDYLYWKYDEMKSLVTKNGIKKCECFDKRSNKTHVSYRFYTHSNTELGEINKIFYRGGKKDVPLEILPKLTDLSLAVWFMDDGKTGWGYHVKLKHSTWNLKPDCCICTDSFSFKGCEAIVELFKNKWDIDSYVKGRGQRKDGVNRYRVVIRNHSAFDLLNIIKPYMVPCMEYKVNYHAYLEWRKQNQDIMKYKTL